MWWNAYIFLKTGRELIRAMVDMTEETITPNPVQVGLLRLE
jgi:hypothetical protein